MYKTISRLHKYLQTPSCPLTPYTDHHNKQLNWFKLHLIYTMHVHIFSSQ